MQTLRSTILNGLFKPETDSHKGQNGRVLVIAGSEKFHGALLMAVETASRLVDIVYVYSTEENLKLIKKLKSEISVFIGVDKKDLWKTAEMADAVLIGPGLAENKNTISTLKKLLKNYPDKKVIIDATALWHLNPEWLHKNCVCTPHSREFKQAFKIEPVAENVLAVAKKYNCTIVLKGRSDYISDGVELWENKTGNPGMTKGGTGDVLAGIILGFLAKNETTKSALAGIYLNGLLGDRLYKKYGTFYNAEDLIRELGGIIKR